MKSFGTWLGALLLISAPASAEMVHLNCPGRSGQGPALFSVDLEGRTVRMGNIDGAGLVSHAAGPWPARITDEIVYAGDDMFSVTINRYALMVRMDARNCRGCTPTTYYGPCVLEKRDRRQF